jgi:hypothetical protein
MAREVYRVENSILVRLDVIDPHTFLDVELRYKDLLEVLNKCGGYALYQQIYKYFEGRSKGYREIKKLESLLLVGSEQFNNNKYIYLKITALKFLKFKESGEIPENINRQTLKPSFRPLMNSVYTFENYLHTKEFINTDLSRSNLDLVIQNIRSVLKANRLDNLHMVSVEKEETSLQLQTKLKILGDRNGIYLVSYQADQSISKSLLKFVCFDFDLDTQENTVLRHIRLISKLLNGLGTKNLMNVFKFTLEIITLGDQRKAELERLTKKAFQMIQKKNEFNLKNIAAKPKDNLIISGISDVSAVTYKVYPDIEGYIKISAKGDSEFSFVESSTVDRLQQLRNKIKGGESD